MDRFYRFTKNIVATVVTKGITPLFSLIIIIMIARLLSVSELGKYTFITTVFMLFQVIGSLSFNFLITREISKNKDRTSIIYGSSIILGFVFSILFFIISGTIVTILKYSYDIVVANWVICIGLLPCFWIAINEAVFMAHECNELITFITIIENLIKVSLCIFVILLKHGIIVLAAVLTLSRIIAALLGYVILRRKQLLTNVQIDYSISSKLIKHVPSFIIIYSLAILFLSTDVLMLSKMKGNYDVGIYSSALKLANFFKIFPDSIIVVLYPLFSNSFHNDRVLFNTLVSKSLKYLLILILPIALLITSFAENITTVIFSSLYLPSTTTLRILTWSMVANAGHSLLGNILMASNCQNKVLKIMVMATSLNIILNLLFIQKWSYTGAAAATLISSVFLFVLCIFSVSHWLIKIDSFSIFIKPILSVSITGYIVWYFKEAKTFVLILIILIVYSLLISLFKVVNKEDVYFFKKALKLR